MCLLAATGSVSAGLLAWQVLCMIVPVMHAGVPNRAKPYWRVLEEGPCLKAATHGVTQPGSACLIRQRLSAAAWHSIKQAA